MTHASPRLSVLAICLALALARPADAAAQDPATNKPPAADGPTSPWLVVPLVSSNPKLGTSFGGMFAYARKFDPDSRVSVIGMNFQYTTTESKVAAVFARLSLGADRHRIVGLSAFGLIKNDYEDYLGTGQPLQTSDDLRAVAGRYLYRVKGNWFVGAQGNAANYQVLGESAQDDAILESLGVRGFESAALGAAGLHDSRDNEDMPTKGWYLNANNLIYGEWLGGTSAFEAYRVDLRAFWPHGRGHVLAVRQFNWFTHDAPANGQPTVILRGYKFGQYLAPYSSSLELEERFSFSSRWGATLFAGAATLYGTSSTTSTNRDLYPTWGGGIHFVIKPDKRLLVNLEYADGVEDNRGVYLKFGYAW